MLVKNVILKETVLSVKLIEKVFLIVLVFLIILKLKFKKPFSVKFVMSDVKNVKKSFSTVSVVLKILKELVLLDVTVLMDI